MWTVKNKKSSDPYPTIPNSVAALYWIGISISAATANAVSFSEGVTFLDIIAVKLTNCTCGRQPTKASVNDKVQIFPSTYSSDKLNWNLLTLLEPYLKVIKFTSRDLVIKFSHIFPGSISNANKNNWERVRTGSQKNSNKKLIIIIVLLRLHDFVSH